jgi:two-component system, cell cycle sensor histidine kinase and response regulator CckA
MLRWRLAPAILAILVVAAALAYSVLGESPARHPVLFTLLAVTAVTIVGLILWAAAWLDQTHGTRARLAAIVEASDDAIVSTTLDAVITSWNAGAERLYGYRAAEAVGRPVSLLVPPDHRDELPTIFDRLHAGERVDELETVRMTKNGRLIDVSLTISPIRDERGSIVGTCGIARDITERKLAEKELYESEERFRAVFESDALGLHVIDAQGRIISANQAFASMLGYGVEELIGRPIHSLTHVEDQPASTDLRRSVLGGDQGHARLEKRYLAKDGSPVWTNLLAVPIHAREGLPRYSIGIVENLRDRRLLEEELRQAQKMEAVGRLAGGVAHDFNNLLLAIRGYSELALGDLDEPGGNPREGIEQIRRAANRAAALTAQLLAFSRKQVLQPQVVELNGLVSGIEDLIRRFLGERIELETRLEPRLPRVRLDPVQMEQAITNLAINARDAMSENGTLTIETSSVVHGLRDGPALKPGTYVRLSVADTGCGMDEGTKERIFEPFFTTKEGFGTGLGLSTVYGFVEQSNGVIVVESAPGEGSGFALYFPAVETPVPPASETPRLSDTGGSETILLVEDEEVVRELLREVLEREGYSVLEAHDGQDALTVAAGHPGRIDVLVTDVVLPRMGGIEAAEALRASRPDLRLLFMSGHVRDVEAAAELRRLGSFLQKPFPPLTLTTRIRELLGETQPSRVE